ncbi:MAG TPA: trans-aconitate 2-methyltransferase [Pseudonocardiaceae bacterium]|nr:trans-aconitate 2-methyltransferase [Pseudonocardiaceae bacterium]
MWDPMKYLTFADHRGRPFYELLGRVSVDSPRRVVDLGCGPGNLTATLAQRWPGATIEALDSSPEMVEAARAAGVDARLGDLDDWLPEPDTDVLLSNAVLQWVPQHRDLLRRWVRALPSGSWLAMQMPGNFTAPSHALLRELADSPRWSALLSAVRLRGEAVVGEPVEYADLLADEGCQADVWETTYQQRLEGEDPILDWVAGTSLRPIRAKLDDAQWAEFRAEFAPMLRAAYPARADGVTWFGFRRIFLVARTG